MTESLLQALHDTTLRSNVVYATIILAALWELAAPLRPLAHSLRTRWVTNIALAAVNWLLAYGLRFLVPLQAAVVAEQHGWGLMHAIGAPQLAAIALGVVLLDLYAYGVHRLSHAVPLLWRLHRVHHSDLDVDFTTTHRHHPADTLIKAPIQAGGVLILGAAPGAVLLWVVLEQVCQILAHSNVRISERVDGALRRHLVVTPGMHRVHHSAQRRETDSNFGQVFPWWDRLFGTYRDAPDAGLRDMTLGVECFRRPRDLSLHRVLWQPLLPGAPRREVLGRPR